MSERGVVREIVAERTAWCDNDWPPKDGEGFLAWFQEKLDLVPAEFRKNAQIVYSYDEGLELCVFYERPESDEEITARAEALARESERLEERERGQYLRLKAKFEKKPE